MSPEQIRGTAVDARADLFALGVVLYELVTGVNPFAGRDPASTIARILESEPERLRDRAPADAPAVAIGQLERMVQTCLEKRAADRFPSARELVVALEEAQAALAGATLAARPRRDRSRMGGLTGDLVVEVPSGGGDRRLRTASRIRSGVCRTSPSRSARCSSSAA